MTENLTESNGQASRAPAAAEAKAETLIEALRIAQSRGVISVRPGPGGGVFAAAQSPMVRLGNSVLALDADETSVAEAVRIRDALDPLLIEDALWYASPADIAEMREILADMASAAGRLAWPLLSVRFSVMSSRPSSRGRTRWSGRW